MLKSIYATLIMRVSDWFMGLAIKFHDIAGDVLGMTDEQKMLYPDTNIYWAMMRTVLNGTNLFTMFAFVADPNSEEWKYQVSILPGEIVWIYSIAELRIQALTSFEARKAQLKLMSKKEILQ